MEALNSLSDVDFPAQSAAFTDTAGSVTGWNTGPEAVVVWADQACYVTVGEGVTATSASMPVPANTPIPFKVPTGTTGVWRVSALQISTGGTVYCKPINLR